MTELSMLLSGVSLAASAKRRKFENATDYPADRTKWMDWFWLLYNLKSEAKEQSLSGDALLAASRLQQQSVWDLMRAELDAADERAEQVVLPTSELLIALNYVRNHWTQLTRYLDDADLSLENNQCEQLKYDVSISRKNWLSAGRLAGGERNAGLTSLVSSAHRCDLDVWAYVNDVLERLLPGETNYEPLLPWHWAQDHPDSIRTYRQDERSDREIRKRRWRQRRHANKNAMPTKTPCQTQTLLNLITPP